MQIWTHSWPTCNWAVLFAQGSARRPPGLRHSLEGPVVVVGDLLHNVHLGPGDTAEGPVPVVPDPRVQVPRVEVLKVLVQGDEVLRDDADADRREEERRWEISKRMYDNNNNNNRRWVYYNNTLDTLG